jgi:hypothetical protein
MSVGAGPRKEGRIPFRWRARRDDKAFGPDFFLFRFQWVARLLKTWRYPSNLNPDRTRPMLAGRGYPERPGIAPLTQTSAQSSTVTRNAATALEGSKSSIFVGIVSEVRYHMNAIVVAATAARSLSPITGHFESSKSAPPQICF